MEFYVGDRIELNLLKASPHPEMDGRPGTITDKYEGGGEWKYAVTLDAPIENPSWWWGDLSADGCTFHSVDDWLRPAAEQEAAEPIAFGADLLAML